MRAKIEKIMSDKSYEYGKRTSKIIAREKKIVSRGFHSAGKYLTDVLVYCAIHAICTYVHMGVEIIRCYLSLIVLSLLTVFTNSAVRYVHLASSSII